MGQVWQELFAESFRETMHGIALFLPRIMVMLMLFVIGVLVGWIVKVLLLRVLRTLRLDAGIQARQVADLPEAIEAALTA